MEAHATLEPLLAAVVGLLFAVSTYLLMSRSFVRMVIGIFVLGNATHLLIFTAGRLMREVPPLVPADKKTVIADAVANPLPQALILTAIVISFALFAFILVLAYRAYDEFRSMDTHHMRVAEPREPLRPQEEADLL